MKGGLFRFSDPLDKLLMLVGSVGCIGDGLVTPLTMYTLSGIMDSYGTSKPGTSETSFTETVDKYSLRLLYIAIFVAISAFLEGICWTQTAERQTSRMRVEYLRSVLRQEVGFFDKQETSSSTFDVISAISSDAHSIQDTIAEKIPNSLVQVSAFISTFVVAFALSWRLAFATLPFAIMFIVPGLIFGKLLMHIGTTAKESYAVAGGVAEQAISSIRTIYSYVGENQTLERFGLALQKSTELGIKKGLAKGLLMGSMGIIFAAWGFLSWAGSILVTERGENGGAVLISGTCVILGGVYIMQALPNLSFISEAAIASTRIQKMIDQNPNIDTEDKNGKILTNLRGEIEFKDVEFSYPSRPNTRVLHRFNLKVEPGKTVGLVGGSGSGKSTVISLLERFYDPTKGCIYLDKHNIKNLQLQWLRSRMGLVNQEPILFGTSIKENILFGNQDASMELVFKASKAANAHDFISKLSDGYDTHVGQSGVQLSGGQKQRIAIARALIRDPAILLLDEATSALDAESERVVQEALDRASKGRTTIIIAHRLSTVRETDTIFVLESGRVIESGSHNELIQSTGGGGKYRKMVELQNQRTPPPVRIRSSRSSYQSSPAYAFSPVVSISMSQSFEIGEIPPDFNQIEDENPKISGSQRRLLAMNAREWKRAALGCLGAAGFGGVQACNGFFLGSIASANFLTDKSRIRSETLTYTYIFFGLAISSFFSNLLQHYNFAVMGERMTKRIREQILEKVFTFEVAWFDEQDNNSAAICARLATEAQLVRSLIADRMSLLVQVFFGSSIAFVLALILSWRVAIVMIAMQPLIIASFYSKSVLMRNMSMKSRKAQSEGSQLASEAVTNHRTITAFSSQNRVLRLFGETQKGPRKKAVKQSWISGLGLFSSQFFNSASVAMTFW